MAVTTPTHFAHFVRATSKNVHNSHAFCAWGRFCRKKKYDLQLREENDYENGRHAAVLEGAGPLCMEKNICFMSCVSWAGRAEVQGGKVTKEAERDTSIVCVNSEGLWTCICWRGRCYDFYIWFWPFANKYLFVCKKRLWWLCLLFIGFEWKGRFAAAKCKTDVL